MGRKIFFGCWIGFALAGYAQLRAESETVYLGKVFLGIGGDHVALPEDSRYRSKFGIKVVRVPVGSSAEKAGLEIGDIVVSIDDSPQPFLRQGGGQGDCRRARSSGRAEDKP
jgi:membrane-associated protease RseP (regulator of RpoE activity)